MRAAVALIAKRATALPQGEARKTLGVGLREVAAQISAGEAEAALSGLKSMQEALKAAEAGSTEAAPAEGDIAAGIAEKRSFLTTRWQRVPTDVKIELGNLKTAIAANVPDEDPGELCGAIETSLDELIGDVQSAIDASIGAGDPGYATARKTIEQQKQKVQNHEIVQLLKKSPLVSGERFEVSVCSALDEIHAALAA